MTDETIALTSNPCNDCERALGALQMYGVPPERAKTVANGIGVLATRCQKESWALNDMIERLRGLLVECRPYVVKADVGEQAHPHLLLNKLDAVTQGPAPETSTQLSEAETLLQAWADPLPPNGKLYWDHVNKARQYFKDRPQRRPDTDIHKSSVTGAAQETSAKLTDDSEPASVDWRSQKASVVGFSGPPCVCGEPNTPGVTHRTDGPCFVTPQR